MKKFKLTKDDVQSLENSANMFDNPILKKGALNIANMAHSGGKQKEGFVNCDWIEATWCQVVE